MRVGIDIQVLLWEPTGYYTYLWTTLGGMAHINTPHHFSLFLYGQPPLEDQAKLRWLKEAFPQWQLAFYWDGPPLTSVGEYWPALFARCPWLARKLDHFVTTPLWGLTNLLGVPLLFPEGPAPLQGVDLFHHVTPFLFPIHGGANVLTVHDLTPRLFPQYHTRAAIQIFEEAYENARAMDLILTSSQSTKRDLVEWLGVGEDRIRVIPGAAAPQYRPMEDPEVRLVLQKHGLSGRPYVLHIGTLEPRKNVSRLVDAFHQLKREEQSLGHRLVLVGRKGWMYEPVFETIRRLGLDADVTWLGFVPNEDLPALLTGADLFVYPSLYEGFGLPPLEAMSCGTPVVASGTSSLPEVVGDAGVLVNPDRADEIAKGMHRVLTDRQLAAALRDRGFARARTFSWERTARLTLAAYEEALDRAGPGGRRRHAGRTSQTRIRRSCRRGITARALKQVLPAPGWG
jgi:glycosyltransferase involved in cell wall biosynthesis